MPEDALASERGSERASALARAWPYALILFSYVATSPYHQGLNNPNEMVRVYMTKAMVDHRTMAIDGVIQEWGPVDDKAQRDGKLYSSKAPLQSLIGVPVYMAMKPVFRWLNIVPTKRAVTTALRIFTCAIPGAIFAGLLLAWSRRRAIELGSGRALGTSAGLAIGLGTMLYPYALTFTGHLAAAITAGGCYWALVSASRHPPGDPRWQRRVMIAGLAAGAAPFAEYPAALVALPAVIGAFFSTPGYRRRFDLVFYSAAGGAGPFLLGLWAHKQLWGSAFKTGYGFLENQAYAQLSSPGFFGVMTPRAEALAGSLFSTATGLFFFSPVLLIGLAALLTRAFRKSPVSSIEPHAAPIARGLAIAGVAGFLLEAAFITTYQGWRGGWTLGPRYIIPVAPLLGLWVIEALARATMRPLVAAFGAVSVITTGFASALYPHLSDIYTNPLKTFVLPSYLRGQSSYGIAHALGLSGTSANLVHLVPLSIAVVSIAFAGAKGQLGRRAFAVLFALASMLAVIAATPEHDPPAVERENQRLWGFWEPASGPPPGQTPPPAPMPPRPPGLIYDALDNWQTVQVVAVLPDGSTRTCTPEGSQCRYGDAGWQHFGPDTFDMNGAKQPVLFMHPVKDQAVRATFPLPRGARYAVLRYGLTDASVDSANPNPVKMRIKSGTKILTEAEAGNVRGLQTIGFAVTSTGAPPSLEIEVAEDGARVFGFDLELYATPR